MFENLIKEINDLKSIFLVNLKDDEDNSLHIIICGASYRENSDKFIADLTAKTRNKTVAELIRDSDPVIPDRSVMYDISFEYYFGYSVRNESYTIWDIEEEFEGSHFRIYSKSKFLDHMEISASVAHAVSKYTHYGICCENHIIDVASDIEPVIKKFNNNKKEKYHA